VDWSKLGYNCYAALFLKFEKPSMAQKFSEDLPKVTEKSMENMIYG